MSPGPTQQSRRPIVVLVCSMTSVLLSADRDYHLPTTDETRQPGKMAPDREGKVSR